MRLARHQLRDDSFEVCVWIGRTLTHVSRSWHGEDSNKTHETSIYNENSKVLEEQIFHSIILKSFVAGWSGDRAGLRPSILAITHNFTDLFQTWWRHDLVTRSRAVSSMDCLTLKWKHTHCDGIVFNGCTDNCQNENFRSSQCGKFNQNDDIPFSWTGWTPHQPANHLHYMCWAFSLTLLKFAY